MILYEIYLVSKTEREHKFLSDNSFLCTRLKAYNTENMKVFEYSFEYEHEVAE